MTTNDKTPDTGTPDVAALIADLESVINLHDALAGWKGGKIHDWRNWFSRCLYTLRTLTARIAELEEALEYEQVIADPYKAEPSEDDGWWVCVMPGVEDGSGPFDTEEEAQAKADEMNAPFREKFQQQLAQAAKAERAKCVAELNAAIDDEKVGGQKRWAYKVAAEKIAANGRDENDG